MQVRHVAYGLDLSCSFSLPGMPTVGGDRSGRLPRLTLDLCTTQELERAWSGSSGPPEWRGRLGDGLDLTIQRGESGDRLFHYGGRARFLLDPACRRLGCAPLQQGLDWQRVLISKVIPAVSVMRGYEGLHAAAVDSPDGAVAIMAPSGMGKSTLVVELLRRGRPLFTDDVLIVEQTDGRTRAHPGTPHMNLAQTIPGGIEPHALGETLGVLADERWLSARASATQPGPVRMLCLLERRPGLTLELQRLPASPIPLLPYMLGLSTDPVRQRERFGLYANLAGSAMLVRLTAGLEHQPAQLGEVLAQALALKPQPAATIEAALGGVT